LLHRADLGEAACMPIGCSVATYCGTVCDVSTNEGRGCHVPPEGAGLMSI